MSFPCVLGEEVQTAVGRLQNAGATVVLSYYSSKKGVTGSDCERVIRQIERAAGETGAVVELVVAPAKCGV